MLYAEFRDQLTNSKMLFSRLASSSMASIGPLRPSTSRTRRGVGRSMSSEPHFGAPNHSTFRLRSASTGPPPTRLEHTLAKKTSLRSFLAGGSAR